MHPQLHPNQASPPFDQVVPSPSQQSACGMMDAQQPAYTNTARNPYASGPAYPRSPSRVQQLRGGYDAQQMGQWMAGGHHYSSSAPGSYNPSPAPSVMSHLSVNDDAVSVMSNQTTMSTFPAMQQHPNIPPPPPQHQPPHPQHLQQQQQQQRLTELRPAGGASACENLDPQTVQATNQIVDSIIHYGQAAHQDARLRYKICGKIHALSLPQGPAYFLMVHQEKVRTVVHLVKSLLQAGPPPPNERGDVDQKAAHAANQLLYSLHFMCRRPQTLAVVAAVCKETEGDLLAVVAKWMGMMRSSLVALQSLLDPDQSLPGAATCGQTCRALARRQQIVLDHLVQVLRQALFPDVHSTKFAIKQLQLLAIGDELKNYLSGRQLIEIALQYATVAMNEWKEEGEEILYRSLTLLNKLVDTADRASAKRFVDVDGVQKVCDRLPQGSERVLKEGVQLLSRVSDAARTVGKNYLNVVAMMMTMLQQVDDGVVRMHGTGLVANLTAGKQDHKNVVLEHNGIAMFTQFIIRYSNPSSSLPAAQSQNLHELLDNTIMCLCNLMTSYPTEEQRRAVYLRGLEQDDFKRGLLNVLSIENSVVRQRALRLINQVLTHCPSWMASVQSTFDDVKRENLIALVFNIIAGEMGKTASETCARLLIRCYVVLTSLLVEHELASVVAGFVRHQPASLSPFEVCRKYQQSAELVPTVCRFIEHLITVDQQFVSMWVNERAFLESLSTSAVAAAPITQAASGVLAKMDGTQGLDPMASMFAREFEMDGGY